MKNVLVDGWTTEMAIIASAEFAILYPNDYEFSLNVFTKFAEFSDK